jgi:hypothetical protein
MRRSDLSPTTKVVPQIRTSVLVEDQVFFLFLIMGEERYENGTIDGE